MKIPRWPNASRRRATTTRHLREASMCDCLGNGQTITFSVSMTINTINISDYSFLQNRWTYECIAGISLILLRSRRCRDSHASQQLYQIALSSSYEYYNDVAEQLDICLCIANTTVFSTRYVHSIHDHLRIR